MGRLSLTAAGLLLLLAAAASPAGTTDKQPPEDIVVTAHKRKCAYRMSGQALSDRELDERAKVWALGTPVRIVLPLGADRKCMIKVGLRLARQGVRVMEFVEANETR
jgi:hypothetical protein